MFVSIFFAYLLADFISGLFHFLEDIFFTFETPFIGKYIIQPNRNHHLKPDDILKYDYWHTISITALFILPLWFLWGIFIGCGPFSITLFGMLLNVNEIHKYHHARYHIPLWYLWIQKMNFFQKDHMKHHTPPKFDTRYCILSPWLNPLLDWVGFWYHLKIILVYFGMVDTSLLYKIK